MNYKLFGPSGLRVSELCLGTLTPGAQAWAVRNPQRRSRAVLAFGDQAA